MTRRHATWIDHVAQPSYSALVHEIGDFFLKRHTLLRTSTDVATRPWRTPRSRAAGPGLLGAREYGLVGDEFLVPNLSPDILWKSVKRDVKDSPQQKKAFQTAGELLRKELSFCSISIFPSSAKNTRILPISACWISLQP